VSRPASAANLVPRRLLGLRVLVYFYRRRLRAHGAQELFAGIGIAAAVAFVLAAGVAQGGIAGSARQILHAVIGPADLQLQARATNGFPEALLDHVEGTAGVERAAPLLERSMRIVGPAGSTNAYVGGIDTSLAVLDGLGRTLPLDTLSHGAIALSSASARAIGASNSGARARVTLIVGGVKRRMRVSEVLDQEAAGALSGALVGVMPLEDLQVMLGLRGRITRVLVQSAPGERAQALHGLEALADGRLIAGSSEQDLELLKQALKPTGHVSELSTLIGVLLGLLLAFNATLLTVPERRQAIADLRLTGTPRSAIVQLVAFQALCLGVAASTVGLAFSYALSRWVFSQSTAYLAEAFTISPRTVVNAHVVLLAGLVGVLATFLACALPLVVDLGHGRAPDAIHMPGGAAGNALPRRGAQIQLATSVTLVALVALASVRAVTSSTALLATVTLALALATALAVPGVFAAVLAAARAVSARAPTPTLALSGLRSTSLRSLALASIGAVALYGSVALAGARASVLDGIRSFAHSYAADAPLWVTEPGDNQATRTLFDDGGARTIARLPGVSAVERFQGAFLPYGPRDVWVLARPPGGANRVLATQTLGGAAAARRAVRRLAQGGWIVLSQQLASEHHIGVGGTLVLATPSGPIRYRVAALCTNLAWIPGVVFMNGRDFTRAWHDTAPSALAVRPRAGTDVGSVKAEIEHAVGPTSGLEVATSSTRANAINALTEEALGQLGVIFGLLLLTAVIALAAAITSSVHQRRGALAMLRLSGAPPGRLRRLLLVEAGLVLAASCLTGGLAGFYGQFVIDAYLRHITGYPVAGAGTIARTIEIVAIVLVAALVIAAIPVWLASTVAPSLALDD
jgi:putative ABC transport system permease protein